MGLRRAHGIGGDHLFTLAPERFGHGRVLRDGARLLHGAGVVIEPRLGRGFRRRRAVQRRLRALVRADHRTLHETPNGPRHGAPDVGRDDPGVKRIRRHTRPLEPVRERRAEEHVRQLRAKGKIKSAKQLKGATVCVQSGTTTEKNLTDYSRANNLALKPVVFEKQEAVNAAYFSGRCQAYTTDASGLASVRNKEAKVPADHLILPELISKEPLGPMVRRGDDEWFAITKWVIYGLVEAEEYGVTQANVEAMAKDSKDPVIGRLTGATEDTGKLLGLEKEWLVKAIKAVGNYGEIFERNVGPKTPLALPRGQNNLWNKGGQMYAFPVR